MNTLADVARFIEAHDGFGIIGHVSPDGDSFGSALALHLTLKAMGKRSVPLFADGMTKYCSFLPGAEDIRTEADSAEYPYPIAVDCADTKRLGSLAGYFGSAKETACIDHHITNPLFAGLNVIEETAATGELIFRLLAELGAEPDKEIATCLYTAIATDTGNFSFSNTTSDSFLIVSKLLKYGIDLPAVNRRLFSEVALGRVRMTGRVIRNMRLSEDGRVAVSSIRKEDFAELSASVEDAENQIDTLRDIDTVEACAVLKQMPDDTIRVSMRGKTYADVSAVASRFSGGGHRLAAGCTMYCGIGEAEETIFGALMQSVKEKN